MRDGNTTTSIYSLFISNTPCFRSDYEGWKLKIGGWVDETIPVTRFRSDYEGWKL